MLQFKTKPKARKKPKGFLEQKQEIKYLLYRIELKKRFLTDNSELDLGVVFVNVPELPRREFTHELAILWCGAYLQCSECKNRGANQAFLFAEKSDRIIERIELNEFHDREGCYKVPIKDPIKQAKKYLLQCKIVSENWEKYAGKGS